MKQILISFLSRFVKDNPKVAKALQGVLLLLAGLPYVLSYLGLVEPQYLSVLTDEVVHWFELAGVVALQLPNKNEGSK